MTQPAAPYREGGGDAPGLPFPRRHIGAWIGVTAVLGALAAFAPLIVLGGEPTRIVRTMKEGGLSMWLLMLLELACPVLVAALAAFAIRGRKLPLASMSGAALVPALVAFAGTVYYDAKMRSALRGAGIDAAQVLRIAFEGVSEEEANLQLGALVCAFALGAVAVGATGVVATVDRARVGAERGLSWLVSAGIALMSAVAAFAYLAVTKSFGSSLLAFLSSVAASLGVVVLAALATASAGAFRGWHDRAEARRTSGAIVVAAIACALGLFLFDSAGVIAERRLVFGAVTGESIDASQRGRILYEWLVTARAYRVVTVLHVAGVFAAFAPALVRASGGPGPRTGAHPFSASALATVGMAAIVVLGFVGLPARNVAMLRAVGKSAADGAPLAVSVPKVAEIGRLRPPTSVIEELSRGRPLHKTSMFRPLTVAAAESLSVGDLLDALPPPSEPVRFLPRNDSFELVVEGESPRDATNGLPDLPDPELVDLVGSNRHVVRGVIDGETSLPLHVARVRVDGRGVLFVANRDGRTIEIDMQPGFERSLRAFCELTTSSDTLYVLVGRETPIAMLARVLAAVDTGWNTPHVSVSQ